MRKLALIFFATLLGATLLPAAPASASPNTFVTMSDGVQIALNVRMPKNYQDGGAYHDADRPSSLMLPFVPLDGIQLGAEPAPCALEDVRCVRKPNG